MKAQKELNTILLANIHNEEKDKSKDFDQGLPKNSPYNKHNWNFPSITLTLQVKGESNTT